MKLSSRKIFLLVIAICFYSVSTFAQVNFTATISPSVIGKDETAQLSFTVENAQQVEKIDPPVLKGFQIVSGPNQQSSFQSINGVTKQSIGVSYLIRPTATGNFTIGEATATINGKTLKSNKVTLKVTKEAQGNSNNQNQGFSFSSPFSNMPGFDEPARPTTFSDYILKDGENVQKKIDKNIFIKAIANKTTCYVGEPIIVTYKLYTRLKAESNITGSPSFNGFSVIDIAQPNDGTPTVEKLDGREYNTYTMRKVQLYPLQSGKFDLDAMQSDNTIYFIKDAYAKQQEGNEEAMLDNFSASAIPANAVTTEHVTLSSKPVSITVKELPTKNKPVSFKGAVGDFTINAYVEKNNFTTDDAGKLIISVSGAGNMTLLNAPEISWPNGVDGFEPKTTDGLNKITVPISGTKVFQYQFTISKAGNYILPAVDFSFFDIKSGNYKTLSTKPIPIRVSQGSGNYTMPPNSTFNNSTEKKNPFGLQNFRWLIVSAIGIFVSGGLFFYLRHENKKVKETIVAKKELPVENNTQQKIIPVHPLALTQARLIENDGKRFYTTLNNELKQFLAIRFGLLPEAINKKIISDEMDKNGIAFTTSLSVQKLMDAIEWQLYTPFTDHDKMEKMYSEANMLIHKLNGTNG